MAGDPTTPDAGDKHIDLRDMDFLVDLPERATVGMRSEKDGYDEAEAELIGNLIELAARSGVKADEAKTLQQFTDRIKKIDRVAPAVEKLLEMLKETRAKTVHEREALFSKLIERIEFNAKQNDDDELLARHQEGREYRSQSSRKGHKTRKKNAQTEAERKLAEQVELKVKALLALFAARGLTVSAESRLRIEETEDVSVLDRWITLAITASSVEDALKK